MDIDLTQHLGAVTREVVDTEREGRAAVMVRITRTYTGEPTSEG